MSAGLVGSAEGASAGYCAALSLRQVGPSGYEPPHTLKMFLV